MVHIKGPPESVRRAASMLRDLISGEPGTASQIIARVRATHHGISSDHGSNYGLYIYHVGLCAQVVQQLGGPHPCNAYTWAA
jgi:hypothetical protein